MIYSYRTILIFILTLLNCFEAFAGKENTAVTLGKTYSLESKVLNKTIPLSIHLPENYDSAKKRYPVLYMMGSDYRARFAMLASTLDYMSDKLIPAMILIGVDLPEGNIILVPARDTGDMTIPDGYINFLETELIPYVNDKYRTAPFRMLLGASNSGLFSTYTMLKKPELFNSYLASSPSLDRMPALLKKQLKDGPIQTVSENKFLHIIYSDDDFDEIVKSIPEFSQAISDYKPEKLTYKVEELENQGHVPVMDIIKFLLTQYPDFNAHEKLDTLDKVQQHFEMLSKRYEYQVHPPISMIFSLGADMIRSKNLIDAEKVFQYSLQVYPDDEQSYVGMGVVRRDQGNVAEAKVMFKKALTIAPDYSLAERLLQRLDK